MMKWIMFLLLLTLRAVAQDHEADLKLSETEESYLSNILGDVRQFEETIQRWDGNIEGVRIGMRLQEIPKIKYLKATFKEPKIIFVQKGPPPAQYGKIDHILVSDGKVEVIKKRLFKSQDHNDIMQAMKIYSVEANKAKDHFGTYAIDEEYTYDLGEGGTNHRQTTLLKQNRYYNYMVALEISLNRKGFYDAIEVFIIYWSLDHKLDPTESSRAVVDNIFTKREINDKGLKCFGMKDYNCAHKNFLLASYMGEPQAQFNMGSLLQHGQGVEKDLVAARIYYQAALENGHPQAAKALSELK